MTDLRHLGLSPCNDSTKSIISPHKSDDRDTRLLFGICVAASLSLLFGLLVRGSQFLADTALFLLAIFFLNSRTICRAISRIFPPNAYVYVAASVLIEAVLIVSKSRSFHDGRASDQSTRLGFLKPKLFPCRTTHTRLIPTKHSFSYSYLMVGVPVDWSGSGPMLSTDRASNSKTWFTVHSDDYLARGRHKEGLMGKLRDYLVAQDMSPKRFQSAYLLTAPRFLGCSFNPISFWYLYDENNELSAMILEVNNTFDERRMYFLQRPDGMEREDSFTTSWNKDFHVSPFNDRDGSYSVTVKGPVHTHHEVTVDNNIALRSDEGKAKIVARVFSTKASIDPTSMTTLQQLLFLSNWWWVGFMTNPRILREARVLWTKNLQVFYRPEVLMTSIGRSESIEESILEPLFRALLQYLVENLQHMTISYTPAAGLDCGNTIEIQSSEQSASSLPTQDISLKVLTPAFYGEMARAHSLCETLEKFCFHPGRGEGMATTSDIEELRSLFTDVTALQKPAGYLKKEMSLIRLRRGEVRAALTSYLGLLTYGSNDISKLSDLDQFVKTNCSATDYQKYLSTTLKLLLADNVAFGFMPLFKAYLILARLTFIFITALAFSWMFLNPQ